MTPARALCAALLCVCMAMASDDKSATPVLACNLKAIKATDRPRYNDLMKRIRAAIRDRNEIANGYTFTLDSKTVTLLEVAEWVSMERLCCPFLTLQLAAAGNRAYWLLTLTGPTGVKKLITAEFSAP